MKIEGLRTEKDGPRAKVAATVIWEDSDRPAQEVYFGTEEEFSAGLSCNPHAFLAGSILPAMHHGEKRVSVDHEICPEFREGLMTAMAWVKHWYYEPGLEAVRIEAKLKARSLTPRPERTAFFFSGGLDSFGTLCANRLNYPPTHQGYIRDGLLIFGQNTESDDRPETFRKASSELRVVAREAGVELLPVYTNIRSLDDSAAMFTINHGAILGAVAHAFSDRLSTVCFSSSDSIPGLRYVKSLTFKPHGSHPLLDPLFRSSELRIRHDGITMSRLDKTRLLADWGSALDNIRVCGPNWPGDNCGKCEKCVRTMLALLAAGVLDRSGAFPFDDVSAELVDSVNIKRPVFGYAVEDDYLELLPALGRMGRMDLTRAIEDLLKRSRRRRRKLVSVLREIDREHLNGILSRTKRSLTAGRRV